MTAQRYFIWAFVLSLGGTLFAGYQSFYKIFVKACAFGETCPIVLGWPACYYGLAIFLVLLVAAGAGLRSVNPRVREPATKTLFWGSLVGLIFAGSLSMQEISGILNAAAASYGLGLPTCVYGAVFYAVLFVLTVLAVRRSTKTAVPPSAI